MAADRRPILSLEGNAKDNFKLWGTRFKAHAITRGWRDPTKPPFKEDGAVNEEHYKPDKRAVEVAEIELCLPDKTLSNLTETIYPSLSEEQKVQPWVILDKLKQQFLGTQTRMADRFMYWHHTKQQKQDSISEWELKVNEACRKCKYDPKVEKEAMRDNFVFGLDDDYSELRQEIFWKEQQLPEGSQLTFEQVVTHAKGYEAAKKAANMMKTQDEGEEKP